MNIEEKKHVAHGDLQMEKDNPQSDPKMVPEEGSPKGDPQMLPANIQALGQIIMVIQSMISVFAQEDRTRILKAMIALNEQGYCLDKNQIEQQGKITKLLEDLINSHGVINQMLKAIEELSELSRAISRLLITGNEKDSENVYEEIADVLIMLQQLMIIHPKWENQYYSKLKKLGLKLD